METKNNNIVEGGIAGKILGGGKSSRGLAKKYGGLASRKKVIGGGSAKNSIPAPEDLKWNSPNHIILVQTFFILRCRFFR